MMADRSIRENYIFNLIRVLCRVLFPVITFTYTSRVLGAEGLGRISFSRSYIAIFSMIAMLGIDQYGIREAAKVRDNKDDLSRFTREVLSINLITSAAALIILFISIRLSPVLQGYEVLLWINSITIVFSGIGMEWLYQALEEYKFISVRAVFFQILGIILMFLFVRDRKDVILYAAISVLASSGSLVINFIHSSRYVDLFGRDRLDLKKHLAPMLWLFAMAVSIELYTVLDTTMLGLMSGDTAVGRYTAGIKLIRMSHLVIMAFGTVLMPRISFCVGKGENEELKKLVVQGYNYAFMISVPAAVGLFILSDEIIRLFCGPEYTGVGLTMRILTVIEILVPFSMATNQQTLVPLGREKLILLSTGAGAVTNIICNSILIPRYAENGAAVGTVVAESVVALICLCNIRKLFDVKSIFHGYYMYWLAAAPIIPLSLFAGNMIGSFLLRIVIVTAFSAVIYAGLLRAFGNQYLAELIGIIDEGVR